MNNYKIIWVKGHYEVVNTLGKFIASGDTYEEAMEEIELLKAA